MTALIGQLTQLRKRFPQLQGRRWLDGRRADGTCDARWLTPEATEMTEQDWNFPNRRFLSYVLSESGQPPVFLVLNAAPEAIAFTLPAVPACKRWTKELDTSSHLPSHAPTRETHGAGARLKAAGRSVLVFSGAAPPAA
jgi:isoamylase